MILFIVFFTRDQHDDEDQPLPQMAGIYYARKDASRRVDKLSMRIDYGSANIEEYRLAEDIDV